MEHGELRYVCEHVALFYNYITVLEIVVRGMNIVENLGMLDTPVPFILK